jgi:hypothetical protein
MTQNDSSQQAYRAFTRETIVYTYLITLNKTQLFGHNIVILPRGGVPSDLLHTGG